MSKNNEIHDFVDYVNTWRWIFQYLSLLKGFKVAGRFAHFLEVERDGLTAN